MDPNLFSEEAINIAWAANQQQFIDHRNEAAKLDYENACRDWARRNGRRPEVDPAPTPLKKQAVKIQFNPQRAEVYDTTEPVSTLKPEDLLPKEKSPIGPAIEGFPGRFMFVGLDGGSEGTKYVQDGVTYILRRYFFGLGAYWEAI